MRTFIGVLFLAIVTSVMFIGCSSKQEAELRALEQWMDTNPDSVISVLEAMDPAKLKNPRINALHILTLTRAIDKKRVLQFEQTDDSLINVAVDYFGRKGPEFDHMRSLFYAGSVNYYTGDYDKAMRYAVRAEKIADKLGDDYWLAKIAELQGFVFNQTYNFTEELNARRIAEKKYHDTGYELNSLFASIDVAHAYRNMEKYDKAVSVVDSVLPMIYKVRSSYLIGSAYHIYTLCLVERQKYAQAEVFVDSVLKYWPDEVRTTPMYVNFAFLCMNKKDHAGFFENIDLAWSKSAEHADSVFVYDVLMRYYEKEGDYKKAYAVEDSILKLNRRQVLGALEQSGTKAQREMLRSELREREWEARWRGMMMWVIGTGAVILAIMLGVGMVYARNRIRHRNIKLAVEMERFDKLSKEYLLKSSEAEKLSKEYLLKSSEADKLSKQMTSLKQDVEMQKALLTAEMGKLFSEQWHSINALCSSYTHKEGSAIKEAASIRADFEHQIKILASDKSRQRIEELIDTVKGGLMRRFREQCGPLISDKNLAMTIYLFAGLSLNAVSVIIDKNYHTVYARRTALTKNIADLAPEDAEEFISELKG